MVQIQDKEDILENIVERWAQSKKDENPNALRLRSSALEAFKKAGFPKAKNEAYKYIPITKTLEKTFSFKEENPTSALSAADIKKHLIPGLEGNIFVFVNGVYAEEHSTVVSPKEQLEVKDIKAFYNNEIEEAAEEQTIPSHIDPFKALNLAMATSGLYLRVPDGKVLEQPIIFYFLSDTAKGKVYQQTKNILTLGKNAQANVVEYHGGEGALASFSNSNTTIFVQEKAVATLHKVQNENPEAVHVDSTTVHQAEGSVFSSFTFSLTGRMIRNNLSISLNGEHCEANMDGLYLLKGKQLVDNETTVDHKKPNCLSNELYKGIMDDQSTGVFNGKIFVRPNAQKTNAFQSNKNILLSDDATINTKPQLEIWADDVKCSHGATTGQLDEEQLFYLRARGLGKETAKALLLHAFAVDVLDKIKLPALKDYLDNMITDRLQN